MMEALKNFRINNKVCLANEIYKMLEGQKSASGRNQVCSLASYLYIACRQEDKTRSITSTKQFWFICIYTLSHCLLFFFNSCHFYKIINSQIVGSWSLKPDNLLKWEPSTPEILCAFGFLFVVLTSLVGNGESGSRVCAEVKGVQYKKKPL
ncbi:LOW QUALITY PROTEIN: hypothetical protein HID58_050261 [Brassica napus]|uniref:Transcription factor TFIIB cyclin-like domain-containing protein n=1 Tax=Brassica napus TaxID=3708 RepID=A0ABQ8A5M1_BRANA|nr:LOW QUALITY PROTEIN: hypothetical protein HID58_050261 [Brassica napus]